MYLRIFDSYDEAYARMKQKNRAHGKGDQKLFVVVEHPPVDDSDMWAVMELRDAVEGEFPYEWAV